MDTLFVRFVTGSTLTLREQGSKRQQKQFIVGLLCGFGLGDGFWIHLGSILDPFGDHVGLKMGKCASGGRSGSEAKKKDNDLDSMQGRTT